MGVLVVVLIVVASLVAAGTVFRATYLRKKMNAIKPYGQLVGVDDGKIHVYCMGNGDKKIVLLGGLGTPLPSADFSPLMRSLSKKHTTICVEYFGVGFSSQSSKPRTCENYVEEIRKALQQAGFGPPYVLMPHSVSSVYSEFYASRYPEEVEAIVSLDGTSSSFYQKVPGFVKFVLPVARIMQAVGIIPMLAILTTNRKKLLSQGYTRKEIHDAIVFSGFSMNRNLLEQMMNSSEHVKETKELPFPESVPFLKIISRKTYETPNKQLKMTPQEYQKRHLERIGPHAKHEILDGNHFIHVNNADSVAEMADRFLASEQDNTSEADSQNQTKS